MDPAERSRVRVLAVDDDEDACRLNKKILADAGYAVDAAHNIRAARKALEGRSYPLLLVDLRLPDGNGLDLLPGAREKDPRALAVIFTGDDSRQSAVAALKAGAYDYLVKPCSPETLLPTVDRAAETYGLQRALDERTLQLETANRELDQRVRDATAEIFSLNEKLQRNVAQLTETNESQTRFMEDMTHELKNPLCVIWGYVSYLLRQGVANCTQEEIERALKNVSRNCDHLSAMIEELLDAARLDSHKISLDREVFPAREAVVEVAEALRLQAEEKGLSLLPELPAGDATVYADRNRLRQILVNLITNAVKFTPSGGTIRVLARLDGTRVYFCVEDTGKGIDPKDAARIFDRFYQVSDPEHRHKGLGLGLHIVSALVDLHEGRIGVESEPGKGARFHFTLPCAPVPAAGPSRA